MVEITDQDNRKKELGKNFICEICGSQFRGQWTDLFGEATCSVCGVPYQILEPSGAKEGQTYPHINVKQKWIWLFKEYWENTRKKCRHGTYLLPHDYPGVLEERRDFDDWVKENHPEVL